MSGRLPASEKRIRQHDGSIEKATVVETIVEPSKKTGPYFALQVADQESVERFPGLVAVADILKGLGCVLAADVEEDFLTTSVVANP